MYSFLPTMTNKWCFVLVFWPDFSIPYWRCKFRFKSMYTLQHSMTYAQLISFCGSQQNLGSRHLCSFPHLIRPEHQSPGPHCSGVSSEPSLQSFSPLQKRTRSMQLPSPQAKKPSWHNGSSVKSRGFTFFSLVLASQFLTESFQSQVCFSMSKAKPAGQRMACRP